MGLEIMQRRLNILFVVNEIFPDAHGGVHTYIYEVSKGLVYLGHSVHILTKKIQEGSAIIENIDGIIVHRYEAKNYGLAFLGQIAKIKGIKNAFSKLVKAQRFDLLNLHSPHAAMAVNLCQAAKKIPQVYTFHALLAEEESLDASRASYGWLQWRKYIKPLWFFMYLRLASWLEKRGLKGAEKIICLSDFTSRCLIEKHGIAKVRITKIPAGVDTERFRPPADKIAIRKILGLAKDNLILLTVRRLVPRMGLDNLLKAMPFILKQCPQALLLIAGKGPLATELQSLIDELGLRGKVLLLGFISDEQLPLYYQASDLFILPSIANEGFGIVTLEALASGIPVLGTPVGATVEILSRLDKSLLFRDSSSESMAELVSEYLVDPSRRFQLANICRQFVLDNYSWDALAKQTQELYLKTLDSAGS
jgi:glycosyltransferase involved in cell wall biosynthesis